MIDIDGKNLERVTHGETFDAFPVFSNDGKKLYFLLIDITAGAAIPTCLLRSGKT